MSRRFRYPRILSWNVLSPDAGFLYTIPQKDDSAKQKHLTDFMQWLGSVQRYLPAEDQLRFVENPTSECLRSEESDKGWESKWVTGSHLTQSDLDNCTLYAVKTWSDGWLMQYRTPEQYCKPCSQDVEVAVFLGPHCKYASVPSAESIYSTTRMDLVKTFILTALAESTDPNCHLNLKADIICLQEVPAELYDFLLKALGTKVYISFFEVRGLLTLVKKKLMAPNQDPYSTWFHNLRYASLVAFELSEPYQTHMDSKWLSVVNYHGFGGSEGSRESWKELAEGIQAYSFEGCSVVAGDFNLNIPRDTYGWHFSFSSLLQGPKNIDYIGLFGKDRTKWRLSDVKGVLRSKKCIQQLKRKIFPILESNSILLDTRRIRGFVAEDVYPDHVLDDSETKDDISSAEFNWRALSDHGPILAEIALEDPGKRSKEWAYWTTTDSNSTIYHLFRFFRMSVPKSPMSPSDTSSEAESSSSEAESSSSEPEVVASMRMLTT